MNLLMITLLTVGSAVGQTPSAGNQVGGYEQYYDDCDGACAPRGISEHLRNHRAIHNTSPQTCYSPRFGCYHSNERHMHRYPAFHGTFYRNSYNYRNYFDYPWHAQPHEPTSLFSHNVGEDQPPPAELRNSAVPSSAPARSVPVAPPVPPQARRTPTAAPAATRPAAADLQGAVPAKRAMTMDGDIVPSSYLAPASATRRLESTAPAKLPATTSSRRITSNSAESAR